MSKYINAELENSYANNSYLPNQTLKEMPKASLHRMTRLKKQDNA